MTRRRIGVAAVLLAAAGSGAGAAPKPEEVEKIRAAVPKEATARPAAPRRMLVLSYQSHDDGRFAGEAALAIMAEQTKAFTVEFVRDPKALPETVLPDRLKPYDAVCVNNSTGGGGNATNGKTLVENLDAYVQAGGGLVGIHAATDNRFGEIFGGFFEADATPSAKLDPKPVPALVPEGETAVKGK